MSLTQITAPYPIFTDLDGSPLDSGYLYIGEINKNPETHPITVYWDAEYQFPAAQPIRTNNGYPWRTGTPAILYCPGQFSLTVRNKRKDLVLYAPVGFGVAPDSVSGGMSADDFTGDGSTKSFALSITPSSKQMVQVYIDGLHQLNPSFSLLGNVVTLVSAPAHGAKIEIVSNESTVIGATTSNLVLYTAPYAGAIEQTTNERLSKAISVDDFGAVGGGADDTSAFLKAALAANGNPILLTGKEYTITTLTLNVDAAFVGHGTIKKKAGTTGHLIVSSANLRICGNITLDQNAANCSNPAVSYNTDCTIYHYGDELILNGVTCLEALGSNLNVVTKKKVILQDCTVTGGWLCVRGVPDVNCKFVIRGGVYSASTVYDNISIYNATDITIDGVTSHSSKMSGIVVTGPNDASTPARCCRIVNNLSYSNRIDPVSGEGGSGIVASIAVSEFIIANNNCWDNENAGIQTDVATYATPSTSDARAVIANNVVRGSSAYSNSGIITNAAQHMTISGNFVRKCKQMLLMSNTPKDATVCGNTFEDCYDGYFINMQHPNSVSVVGNTFYNCISGGSSGAFSFNDGTGVSFFGNHITGIQGDRNLFRLTNVTNYSIVGNYIYKGDAGTGFLIWPAGVCTGGYIADNKIQCNAASFQYYIVATGATVTGTTTRNNEIVCSGIQTSPNRYIYNGSAIVADSDVINGVKNYFSAAPTMFTPMQGATAGIAGALKMWNGSAWV